MAGKAIIIDRGWHRIKTQHAALKGQGVKVGLRAGKANDGVQIVDYATWNEFGTADGRVPSRPFMRRTSDFAEKPIRNHAALLVRNLVAGRLDVAGVMHGLGLWYQARIRATIRNSKQWAKPNAPSTVKAKGSTTPLIDDGMLIGNIDYERTKL